MFVVCNVQLRVWASATPFFNVVHFRVVIACVSQVSVRYMQMVGTPMQHLAVGCCVANATMFKSNTGSLSRTSSSACTGRGWRRNCARRRSVCRGFTIWHRYRAREHGVVSRPPQVVVSLARCNAVPARASLEKCCKVSNNGDINRAMQTVFLS